MPELSTATVMSKATRDTGTIEIAPITIPEGATYYRFAFPKVDWTEKKAQLRLRVWISFDAGKSWRYFGGMMDYGGPIYDEKGRELLEAFLRLGPIPEEKSSERQIKATVEIVGGVVCTDCKLSLGN